MYVCYYYKNTKYIRYIKYSIALTQKAFYNNKQLKKNNNTNYDKNNY